VSAVAIILLIVLLAEYEILRVTPGGLTPRRKRALLVAIIPLLVVSVIIGALRIDHLASMRQ
jgi:hypothetical protein